MTEGRIVSLSNERSDRPSSVAGYFGGWKGNTADDILMVDQGGYNPCSTKEGIGKRKTVRKRVHPPFHPPKYLLRRTGAKASAFT